MTSPTLRTAVLAVVCLITPALAAAAAPTGSSNTSLDPVCVTKTGAALFFMEYGDDCGGVARHCRNSRWAWAAFKPGWDFEPLGDAVLDDVNSPEANVQSMRQLFKAPTAHTCATYPRVARVRSPDLPDSDSYFQYSVEAGTVVLHWQAQKLSLPAEAKLWRAGWCAPKRCPAGKDGPRADPKALDSGLTLFETLAGKRAPALLVPTVELPLATETLLGFPEPGGEADRGFLALLVPQAKLRQLQAQLLHQDARATLEKAAGDLLAVSKAAGLLDAALQLAPAHAEARYDYARLFAQQGEAASAARELEQLKGGRELRAKVEADKAFAAVKGKEPLKRLLEAMK